MNIMNTYEQWYMDQLNNIIENGQCRGDRTGTGVISLPNLHYTHDLRQNYPLMNSRFFNFQQPITEMIWMMSGSSNIQYLIDNACPFWNKFATPTEIVSQELLTRAERLVIHANNRGVSVAETLASMAVVPVDEIDALLDKHKVPNARDHVIPKGELGPVYGVMWRHWPNPNGGTFDQLQYALDTLKKDPNSRRVVVDCWNPSYLPDPTKSPAQNAADGKMALTPCHFTFGFYTWELTPPERYALLPPLHDGEIDDKVLMAPGKIDDNWDRLYDEYGIPTHYLDLSFTMRSNDWVLGQPANMNMYSALLLMFAKQLNMVPRYVNYEGWDCHVYSNHLEGVMKLQKVYSTGEYQECGVQMSDIPLKGLFEYHHTDFTLKQEYKHGERIKFPIAV